jgi:hypothetical protein
MWHFLSGLFPICNRMQACSKNQINQPGANPYKLKKSEEKKLNTNNTLKVPGAELWGKNKILNKLK